MIITFQNFECFENDRYSPFIEELIAAHSLKRICEIGPGPKPSVTPSMLRKHGLHYTAIDNCEREVGRASAEEVYVADVCVPKTSIPGAPYDMIVGRAVAEHFRDSTSAYENMFSSLASNGLCVSTFSTLYSLPLFLNRILPDYITDFLLDRFAPRDRDVHDKFKAYYSHCRGPVRSQIDFFQRIGYEILEYRAYFGHGYYKHKLPLLDGLEKRKTQLLVKAPIGYLTSMATVILKRPSCTKA